MNLSLPSETDLKLPLRAWFDDGEEVLKSRVGVGTDMDDGSIVLASVGFRHAGAGHDEGGEVHSTEESLQRWGFCNAQSAAAAASAPHQQAPNDYC